MYVIIMKIRQKSNKKMCFGWFHHYHHRLYQNDLDLSFFLSYKCYMRITQEAKTSLKREYALYANAIAFYKKAIGELERKHRLRTNVFLKRFESGQLGDDTDYFDWYAFAKLLFQWQQAQSAIRHAVRS